MAVCADALYRIRGEAELPSETLIKISAPGQFAPGRPEPTDGGFHYPQAGRELDVQVSDGTPSREATRSHDENPPFVVAG